MSLVNGILEDFSALIRQEMQLLRDEIKLELSKAGRAASGFGIGAIFVAVGALFLLLMLVHGLPEWTGLPLWASFGLVGGLLAGIGVAFIARAQSLAGSVQTTPRRTFHALKENVQWIKERVS
jgi:drug/metabolite transporter (DMT)-like permease